MFSDHLMNHILPSISRRCRCRMGRAKRNPSSGGRGCDGFRLSPLPILRGLGRYIAQRRPLSIPFTVFRHYVLFPPNAQAHRRAAFWRVRVERRVGLDQGVTQCFGQTLVNSLISRTTSCGRSRLRKCPPFLTTASLASGIRSNVARRSDSRDQS